MSVRYTHTQTHEVAPQTHEVAPLSARVYAYAYACASDIRIRMSVSMRVRYTHTHERADSIRTTYAYATSCACVCYLIQMHYYLRVSARGANSLLHTYAYATSYGCVTTCASARAVLTACRSSFSAADATSYVCVCYLIRMRYYLRVSACGADSVSLLL
jgi:hypothetical protein